MTCSADSSSPLSREDRDARSATRRVRELIGQIGFDLAGIGPARPFQHAEALRQWLRDGCAGDMHYMEQWIQERLDPAQLLPGAQSMIVVACSYHSEQPQAPAASASAANPTGRVARYALGDDYHEVLKTRLHQLADAIRQEFPGAQTKCCVDTSPILEREAAVMAGLGWIGKNTCLINPDFGSWIVLGELITTLPLEVEVEADASPPVAASATDRCGSCTRCLQSCPTGAIVGPRQLDARRCISYLTLEHRQPLTPQQHRQADQWLAGCDICQEVCPWNSLARGASIAELQSRLGDGRLDCQEVLNWSEQDYRRVTRRSALRRAKLPMLQARARAILESAQTESRATDEGERSSGNPPA